MTTQSDGKIAVVGSAYAGPGAAYAARFLANGTLDPAFGVDGQMTTDFGVGKLTSNCSYGGRALSVRLQPDGKWIVAGTYGGCEGTYFALARYKP